MLSLASLRYRSVLAAHGGPVQSIEAGEFPVFGRRLFQANARLKKSLAPQRRLQIYSDADGTGTHSSPMVARHIAVSEALERWAYHATVRSERRSEFGFDIDESSNGMAAFPGFSRAPARRAAVLEAVERFCLLNWWEGNLEGEERGTDWPGTTALAFESPIGGVAVLLYARSDWGFHVYGHAAAESFGRACEKAVLELVRHEWVLRSRMLSGVRTAPTDLLERRASFFAGEEGHRLFRDRIAARATRPPPNALKAEVAGDSEISGPWSEYATVWRFVLRPPSERFLSEGERYFFW